MARHFTRRTLWPSSAPAFAAPPRLAHCVGAAQPRHVIVDSTLLAEFAAAFPSIGRGFRCWSYSRSAPGFARIEHDLSRYSGDPLNAMERPTVVAADCALYIYTSGTTGLPKAANVSHYRLMPWSHWFAGLMDVRPSDRMYNCLPMYHSIGGVVAIGAVLVGGGSVLLRERFSASHFWSDVTDHRCTLFQYIGELCRYLVSTPLPPAKPGIAWQRTVLRQRSAGRHLGTVCRTVQNSANSRVLCGDREQFLALQCRRRTRRDRADPVVPDTYRFNVALIRLDALKDVSPLATRVRAVHPEFARQAKQAKP